MFLEGFNPLKVNFIFTAADRVQDGNKNYTFDGPVIFAGLDYLKGLVKRYGAENIPEPWFEALKRSKISDAEREEIRSTPTPVEYEDPNPELVLLMEAAGALLNNRVTEVVHPSADYATWYAPESSDDFLGPGDWLEVEIKVSVKGGEQRAHVKFRTAFHPVPGEPIVAYGKFVEFSFDLSLPF